jgi:hypothetical protein
MVSNVLNQRRINFHALRPDRQELTKGRMLRKYVGYCPSWWILKEQIENYLAYYEISRRQHQG